ncbi:hypothetical protein VPHK479_0034 [Vibrio phage K479]
MITVIEKGTDKPRQIDIQVSGQSAGGANYAMRVLSHYKKTGNQAVSVGVGYGAKQDHVMNTITNQVKLIEDTVGNLPVQLTLVKQYRDY